jgi:hypothetical protein
MVEKLWLASPDIGRSGIGISGFLLPCARDFQFPDPRLCGISRHVPLDRTTCIQPLKRRDFSAAKCRVDWQLRHPDNH